MGDTNQEGVKKDYLIWLDADKLWWRANSSGYTPDILQAGLYTETYAKYIQRGSGPERRDRAIPLASKRAEIEAIRDAAQQKLNAITELLETIDADISDR